MVMSNVKKYVFIVGFIVSMFFAISFLITAIVSLLNPETATGVLKINPYFSWANPMTGYLAHISGNIFFTTVAIFFVLYSWREYNRY